jgi:hypothetical protein
MLLGEIVQNNQKTGFYAVFYLFGGHLSTLNGLKKVLKGLQVARTYGSISKLKNNPIPNH